MSEAHEHAEQATHAAGHSKSIALLISVLALFLALSETLGKSAQTNAVTDNVQASDLWSFFQAKTIRQTVLNTAAEVLTINGPSADPGKAAAAKRAATPHSRAIIIMRLPRPRFRSASCWRRPPSSPACCSWCGSPEASELL